MAGQGGLPGYAIRRAVLSKPDREGGVPRFGTPHPARDYPSAPSVDLRHDGGKLHCGRRHRQMERESESEREQYLNRMGRTRHSVCV